MSIITFSDIYNGALKRTGQDTSDSTLVGYIKDWINYRYKEICSLAPWPWLQDTKTIRMLAEYTTGTVACTTLTTSVTGTSTVWTKAMTDRKFKFDDFEETYRIAQWSSATGITLADTYNGSTLTAGTYSIFQDEYLCPITWENIRNIRDSRNGRDLDFVAYNILRDEKPNPYPSSTDPTQYTFLETRDVTRMDGTITGTFQVDEIVDGGTSSAYGKVKKVGSDYLYIQILYGTFSDAETITGATSSATMVVDESNGYTEGNVGGALKVLFDPPPYRNILYNCEIIKKPVDLSEDTDEPLVPELFRDIIFYYAIADIYSGKMSDEATATKWEAKALTRVKQMIDRYSPDMGNPRIRPAYPRTKYV